MIQKKEFDGKLKIYCDGGGQKKGSYFSYKVYETNGILLRHMDRFLLRNLAPSLIPTSCSIRDDKGHETNNIAEYAALYYSMLWFMENVGLKPVRIFTDSKLVVNQVNTAAGIPDPDTGLFWKVNKEHLQPWHYAVTANRWPTMELTHVSRTKIEPILGH